MTSLYMIACGRIWEREIFIITEEDAWRSQIEDEMSVLDTIEDAAYVAGWDDDDQDAAASDPADS